MTDEEIGAARERQASRREVLEDAKEEASRLPPEQRAWLQQCFDEAEAEARFIATYRGRQ